MSNTFFISDTHFGHDRACSFMRADGVTKMRPFESALEADGHMVSNWNALVRHRDTVYHLGDVEFNGDLEIIKRLNGRKVLVRGNHDQRETAVYLKYFADVLSLKKFSGFVATHIPIHPCSVERYKANVHGHLHDRVVDDPRYLCVSVEQIGYRPISIEEVRVRLLGQKEAYSEAHSN